MNISYRQRIELKHNFVYLERDKFKKSKTEKWRIYELELRYGKKRKFDKFKIQWDENEVDLNNWLICLLQ